MQRAIFLDRDGVICENRKDHVKSWNEFQFLPGAFDALRTLRGLGLPVFVVTNQAIVNRGITPASVIEEIHNRMTSIVRIQGGRIDDVYYCPHRPDEGCSCRKPGPGLLEQVAQDHQIDLGQSYMVGDAQTDINAGQAVGCRTFLVLTGRGLEQLPRCAQLIQQPFETVFDLEAAVKQIQAIENKTSFFSSYELDRMPVKSQAARMAFA